MRKEQPEDLSLSLGATGTSHRLSSFIIPTAPIRAQHMQKPSEPIPSPSTLSTQKDRPSPRTNPHQQRESLHQRERCLRRIHSDSDGEDWVVQWGGRFMSPCLSISVCKEQEPVLPYLISLLQPCQSRPPHLPSSLFP